MQSLSLFHFHLFDTFFIQELMFHFFHILMFLKLHFFSTSCVFFLWDLVQEAFSAISFESYSHLWGSFSLVSVHWWAYLFVELVDYSLGPLQVQLLTLQWSIDISQLDAHLTHQHSIIFIGPVNTGHSFIAHLERSKGRVEQKEGNRYWL